MSPRTLAADLETDGFPRVSGDEPSAALAEWLYERFSPRERG